MPIWNRTIYIDFGYDVNRKMTGTELFIESYKILVVIYKRYYFSAVLVGVIYEA